MSDYEVVNKARSIIDSEYDVLQDFELSDLEDYLMSLLPAITREQVALLYCEMF